jgi:hypothetical protein
VRRGGPEAVRATDVVAFEPRQPLTRVERDKASSSSGISALTKVERDASSRSSRVSR